LQLAVKAVVATIAVMGTAGMFMAHFAFGGNVSLSISDGFSTGLNGHLRNPAGSASFRIVAAGPQNLLSGPVTVVVSEHTPPGPDAKTKTFRVNVPMVGGVANYSYQPLDPSTDTVTFSFGGAAQTVTFLQGDYTSKGYVPKGTVRTVQSPTGGNTISGCGVNLACYFNALVNDITSIPQQVVALLAKELVAVVNGIIIGWLGGLLQGLSGMIAMILHMPYLGTAFGGTVYSFWGAFLVLGLLFWLFVLVLHLISVTRGKPPGLVPRLVTMGVTFIAMYYSLGLTDMAIRFSNGVTDALFTHWAPSVTGTGTSAGAAMLTLAGMTIGLNSPVLISIGLVLLAFVVAYFALWAFLTIVLFGVISPLMIAWGALAKDYMRALGYLLLLARAAFVPVLIGIAWLVMAHATVLGTEIGVGFGSLFVDFAVLTVLVVVLIMFWTIPMLKWFLNPLLMGADQAGSFLEKAGGIAGTVLSVVGMATGQPEIMAAGAAVKTFGHTAKSLGDGLKAGAERDYDGGIGAVRDLMDASKHHDAAKKSAQNSVVRPAGRTVRMRDADGADQEYAGWRAPGGVRERAVRDLRTAGFDVREHGDSFWVPKADQQRAEAVIGGMFKRHNPYWQGDDGYITMQAGQPVKVNSPPRNGIFMGRWGGAGSGAPDDGQEPEPDAGFDDAAGAGSGAGSGFAGGAGEQAPGTDPAQDAAANGEAGAAPSAEDAPPSGHPWDDILPPDTGGGGTEQP
jgi:hypothetical protein